MLTTQKVARSSASAAALRGQYFAALCLAGAIAAGFFMDALTSVLLVLSTSLFFAVVRYSRRYLAGDPGQGRFTFWLCGAGACVFALILVQNLLLFALAWTGISLSLHQLLQFYSHRPGARLAARKKFLISRLGDCALAAALALAYATFGTWDFAAMFTAADHLRQQGPAPLPATVHWLACLLAFAALLKSAQFPFHSWLPDTMETPTPVSALMHAGIINGGGILILRLRPIIALSDAALLLLALTGGFTALFASVVMLTQASVKRQLAFSTVAQMGFMMLECGVGAFHLALLHIVAHSFYKAFTFLSSGSVVADRKTSGLIAPRRPVPAGVLLSGLAAALAVVFAVSYGFGAHTPEQPVLTGIFTLALAQLFWTSWTAPRTFARLPFGLLLGVAFTVAYFLAGFAASHVLAPLQRDNPVVTAALLCMFCVVAVMQTQLPRAAQVPWLGRMYVHARNGFYFNTLANRITMAIWPVRMTGEGL